jgi:hypothetical protein
MLRRHSPPPSAAAVRRARALRRPRRNPACSLTAADLRPYQGNLDGHAAVALAGGSPELAWALVRDWAASPSSDGALAWLAALGRTGEVDADAARRDLELAASALADTDEDLAAARHRVSRAGARLLKEAGRAHRVQFTEADLDRTVSALACVSRAAHPGPWVDLYRGIGEEQADRGLAEARAGRGVTIPTRAFSSWTDDPAVARHFAGLGIDQHRQHGAVLHLQVPPAAILLSHRAGFRLLAERREGEVVLGLPGVRLTREEALEVLAPERRQTFPEIGGRIGGPR